MKIINIILKILDTTIFENHYLIVSQSGSHQYNTEISINTTLGDMFKKDLMDDGIKKITEHIMYEIGEQYKNNFVILNIIKKGRRFKFLKGVQETKLND